jgi:hypothetical protein
MDKNQGKPCETCVNEEKTGGMYPCAVCRGGDKWVAKKVVGGEEESAPRVSGEPLFFSGGPFVTPLAVIMSHDPEEPPKRPASLLALADEIADSLLSWRDGSGGSKDLRKAQRILTALIMLEEEDVED